MNKGCKQLFNLLNNLFFSRFIDFLSEVYRNSPEPKDNLFKMPVLMIALYSKYQKYLLILN